MKKDLPIPTSAKRVDTFAPATLKDTPKAVEFQLRIPTPSERDILTSTLYELGLMHVTEESMRAHMVNELFHIDWIGSGVTPGDTAIVVTPPMAAAGATVLSSKPKAGELEDRARHVFEAMLEVRTAALVENEVYAESQAEMLDGYWIRSEADQRAMDLWTEQEGQRLLEEEEGVTRPETPLPNRSVKVREHAKVRILLDEIQKRSPKLRAMIAKRMDFGARNALLMARLHVIRMTPLDKEAWPADLEIQRDDTGLLSVDFTDRLREHIGAVAWSELVNRCDSHYSLSEAERKNSDSPPEKQSDQTGSLERSGDSESKGGNATVSSTGPVPADA